MILSGDFQRVQVLLSGNENNQSLLTCIDCTHESGKVNSLPCSTVDDSLTLSRLLPVLEIKFVSMNQQQPPNDHCTMFVLFSSMIAFERVLFTF